MVTLAAGRECGWSDLRARGPAVLPPIIDRLRDPK
jgi:hypothetical protein